MYPFHNLCRFLCSVSSKGIGSWDYGCPLEVKHLVMEESLVPEFDTGAAEHLHDPDVMQFG